jgi:flagellar hook-length control protein FliK
MHINLASFLTDQKIETGRKPSFATNPEGDFLSIIGRSMPTGTKAGFFLQRPALLGDQSVQTKTGADFMEAFRTGLLSKGKPFNQVHLDSHALPLLEKLMLHCGYSPNTVADSIQSLRASSRDGKIIISEIFSQLQQLPSPKDNRNFAVVISSEAVPYLETVLGEFGLGPNAVRTVLDNGRTPQGDLDFESVIKSIEKVANPATRGFPGIVDLQQSQTIVRDLQRLAIQVPAAKKTGFLHIEDFVTSLKRLGQMITQAAQSAGETESVQITPDVLKNLNIQMPQTGGQVSTSLADRGENPMLAAGNQNGSEIPVEVQTIINRLLEQVSGKYEKKPESLTGIMTDSKIQFDDPVSKQLQAHRAWGQQAVSESQQAQDSHQVLDLEGPKVSDPEKIGHLKLVAETAAPKPISDKVQAEVLEVKSSVKAVDVHPDPIEHRRFEPFVASSQRSQKPNAPLPNYLMDQMGRQIARAINRGDGVIRFQLKPPEMGFVKLEMQLTDNQLSLSVAAENSSVKELLLSNIHELRETLQSQGIRIDKLDIQLNNDFNQSLANFQEGRQKESRASSGDGAGEDQVNHDEAAEVAAHNRASPRNDSTIELVA